MVEPMGFEPVTSSMPSRQVTMTASDANGQKCPSAISLECETSIRRGQQRTRKDRTFPVCPGRVMAQIMSQIFTGTPSPNAKPLHFAYSYSGSCNR
jgi:hypothetical protein